MNSLAQDFAPAAKSVRTCKGSKIREKFGKNQLTRAEAYNIIFNCDELFINV